MPGEIAQPSASDRIDVGSLVNEVADEEFALEDLAGKGDLTAEDLRGFLGDDAKEMKDEDILGLWKETSGEGEAASAALATPDGTPPGAAPSTPAWDRAWRFYNGDKPVEDTSKFTMKEFLESGIGYKAGGADHRRTVDELVRLAQRVPLDEQRISGLLQQVQDSGRTLADLRKANTQFESDSKMWLWALQDPTGARFQALQEKFLNSAPPEVAPVAQPSDDMERAGEQLYRERIYPQLQEMARTYTLDAGGSAPAPEIVQHLGVELDREFRRLIEADASAMQNPQYAAARIQQIIQYDLPNAMQQAGYRPMRTGAAPVAPVTPTPQHDAATRAELANLRTELAKQRVKNAPGPGAGSGAGAGRGGPDFSKVKSFRDVMDVVRSPETQWDLE